MDQLNTLCTSGSCCYPCNQHQLVGCSLQHSQVAVKLLFHCNFCQHNALTHASQSPLAGSQQTPNTSAAKCVQMMMKMAPSNGKRPRAKRMTTFSGHPLPGLLDQDGKVILLSSSSHACTAVCGQHALHSHMLNGGQL